MSDYSGCSFDSYSVVSEDIAEDLVDGSGPPPSTPSPPALPPAADPISPQHGHGHTAGQASGADQDSPLTVPRSSSWGSLTSDEGIDASSSHAVVYAAAASGGGLLAAVHKIHRPVIDDSVIAPFATGVVATVPSSEELLRIFSRRRVHKHELLALVTLLYLSKNKRLLSLQTEGPPERIRAAGTAHGAAAIAESSTKSGASMVGFLDAKIAVVYNILQFPDSLRLLFVRVVMPRLHSALCEWAKAASALPPTAISGMMLLFHRQALRSAVTHCMQRGKPPPQDPQHASLLQGLFTDLVRCISTVVQELLGFRLTMLEDAFVEGVYDRLEVVDGSRRHDSAGHDLFPWSLPPAVCVDRSSALLHLCTCMGTVMDLTSAIEQGAARASSFAAAGAAEDAGSASVKAGGEAVWLAEQVPQRYFFLVNRPAEQGQSRSVVVGGASEDTAGHQAREEGTSSDSKAGPAGADVSDRTSAVVSRIYAAVQTDSDGAETDRRPAATSLPAGDALPSWWGPIIDALGDRLRSLKHGQQSVIRQHSDAKIKREIEEIYRGFVADPVVQEHILVHVGNKLGRESGRTGGAISSASTPPPALQPAVSQRDRGRSSRPAAVAPSASSTRRGAGAEAGVRVSSQMLQNTPVSTDVPRPASSHRNRYGETVAHAVGKEEDEVDTDVVEWGDD